MKRLCIATFIVSLDFFCAAADLPRSTPESQGISSAAIKLFIEAADKQINQMHSFMFVRHGQVVAECWWAPYSREVPHVLYSLSKSFTSTAVGLAIADGKLSLDDEVIKFFPDDAPAEPSKNLKSMRLHDLLRMSAGHDVEVKFNDNKSIPWTKLFLAHPVPFKPGTHFQYNTPGTYMQSAIVQKVTGQTTLDFLRPRIFEPLDIKIPRWDSSPQGINLGGYGLYLRTEDIAKFGQLYLQKGQWQGKQLIPAAWVEAATARQTSNGSNPKSDWDQGYGYQFWRCQHNAFRGDGAYGQFCVVLPEQDAVIAITSGTGNLQAPLDLIWNKLLPEMKPAALPENKDEQTQLKTHFASLSVRQPQGAATSPAAAAMAGKEFQFAANRDKLESLKLEIDPKDNATTIILKVGGNSYRVPVGYGNWQQSRLEYDGFKEQPVAACGAWTPEGAYVVRFSFYESAHYFTATLKLAGEELLCDMEAHPTPGKQPQLKGTLTK